MLQINFINVEELIFHDTIIQNLLPAHMFSIFEQWRLSKRVSYLRDLGKHATLDFLNQLTPQDILILEAYFDDKIIIEKLSYDIVLNIKAPITENQICNELCGIAGFNYLSICRDELYLYISFWR